MQFASYRLRENSEESFGVVSGQAIVDLKAAFGGRFASLKALLQADAIPQVDSILLQPNALQHTIPLTDISFLPVIPEPGKIWCCGLNYREHVHETNNDVSKEPAFFLRVPDSQIGHEQGIILPPESSQLDYEGEIAVVIGKTGRRIPEERAWDYIAGYSVYNDASIRDWQLHTRQWGPGKNFWRTGAFGPWLVTLGDLGADAQLTLVTRLNGVEVQRATTSMMIHSIAKQIAYLSTVAPLRPGDVIVTGTPGGVGAKRQPPVWMAAGDLVEVEVSGIGVLRNTIISESELHHPSFQAS